jgi:hypothetical protein
MLRLPRAARAAPLGICPQMIGHCPTTPMTFAPTVRLASLLRYDQGLMLVPALITAVFLRHLHRMEGGTAAIAVYGQSVKLIAIFMA